MRYARIVVAALALSGCSPETTPSSPETPNLATALWGMVVDDFGVCIAGASVRVVGGQALDLTAAQQHPCDVWGYGGGFVLAGLTAGVGLTLRVSAPGYVTKDTTVVPSLAPQTALLITPTKE